MRQPASAPFDGCARTRRPAQPLLRADNLDTSHHSPPSFVNGVACDPTGLNLILWHSCPAQDRGDLLPPAIGGYRDASLSSHTLKSGLHAFNGGIRKTGRSMRLQAGEA